MMSMRSSVLTPVACLLLCLPLAAQELERVSVAVLPFECQDGAGYRHWQNGLRGMLSEKLAAVARVRVLSENSIRAGYHLIGKRLEQVVDRVQALRFGRLARVDRVIVTRFGLGDERILHATVLSVADGAASKPVQARGPSWTIVLARAAEQVLDCLGIQPRQHEVEQLGARISPSPPALERKSRSIDARFRLAPLPVVNRCVLLALEAAPDDPSARVTRAWSLFAQGKRDDALKLLAAVNAAEPRFGYGRYAAGALLLSSGQLADAELSLRTALSLRPDTPKWLSVLGACLDAQKRFIDAAPLYRRTIDLEPLFAEGHARFGMTLLRFGKRDEALETMREAERLDPGNAAVREILADCYWLLGDFEHAVAQLDAMLAIAKRREVTSAVLAAVENKRNEWASRLEPVFVDAVEPKRWSDAALEAELARRASDAERARIVNPFRASDGMRRWAAGLVGNLRSPLARARALHRALTSRLQTEPGYGKRTAEEVFGLWNAPAESFSCQELAKLYLALARSVGLAAYYVHLERDYRGDVVYHDCAAVFVGGRCLLVDPAYRWFGVAHRDYAVLDDLQAIAHHLFQGSVEGDCRLALRLDPDSDWGRLRLVHALLEAEKLEEAERVLDDLSARGVDRWDARLARGVLHVHKGELEVAEKLIRAALELNPKSYGAHSRLALLLEKRGELEAARTHLRRALKEQIAPAMRRSIEGELARVEAALEHK